MLDFDPAENTMIAVYGPPEYFETLTDEPSDDQEENQSFFGKLIAILKRLIDFIKGLFQCH